MPLTPEVLAAHLTGEVHIGLYPMLPGDQTCWLAAGIKRIFNEIRTLGLKHHRSRRPDDTWV